MLGSLLSNKTINGTVRMLRNPAPGGNLVDDVRTLILKVAGFTILNMHREN